MFECQTLAILFYFVYGTQKNAPESILYYFSNNFRSSMSFTRTKSLTPKVSKSNGQHRNPAKTLKLKLSTCFQQNSHKIVAQTIPDVFVKKNTNKFSHNYLNDSLKSSICGNQVTSHATPTKFMAKGKNPDATCRHLVSLFSQFN